MIDLIRIIKSELSNPKPLSSQKSSPYDFFYPVNFPDKEWKTGRVYKPVAGVYLLGNFYVGQSYNIKSRIKSHISGALRGAKNASSSYESVLTWITSGRKIPVFWLGDDQNKEFEKAVELTSYMPLPLVSQLSTMRGYDHRKKIQECIAFLRSKGYEVTKID